MCCRPLSTLVLPLGFALVLAAAFAATTDLPLAGQDKPKSMLRHVVLFKFKADTSKEQIAEVVKAFGELPKKIDGISGFEWGTDVSPEMRSEGFTHCFIVTFPDAKARDAYLPHAAHGEFVKLALPRIEKVLVVDFVPGS
jgi:hypothetical protein